MRFIICIILMISTLASCQSSKLLKTNPLIQVSETNCNEIVQILKYKSTIINHGNEVNEKVYTFNILDDFMKSNSSLSIPSLNFFQYKSKSFIVVFKVECYSHLEDESFDSWINFKEYVADSFDYDIYYNLTQFLPERLDGINKVYRVFRQKDITYFLLNIDKNDENKIISSLQCSK